MDVLRAVRRVPLALSSRASLCAASVLHSSAAPWGRVRGHCDSTIATGAASVSVSFTDAKGVSKTVTGKVGENLVHLAHENDIELEGACECSLACSTCHVILEDAVYDGLETASEEEEDLLDLAFGLTATSRLGCQVKLTDAMAGARIRMPSATRNFYVDGHKPKPH